MKDAKMYSFIDSERFRAMVLGPDAKKPIPDEEPDVTYR